MGLSLRRRRDAPDRLATAPMHYAAAHDPADVARQVTLLDPQPRPGEATVTVTPAPDSGRWRVDVVTRDRRGLLALIAGVLDRLDLPIERADVATWPDGTVLDTFVVVATTAPDPDRIARAIESGL